MACICSPSHNSVCDHSNATVWCWVSRAPPPKSCERVYTRWRSRFRHTNRRPSERLERAAPSVEKSDLNSELDGVLVFIVQYLLYPHPSWLSHLRAYLLKGGSILSSFQDILEGEE